MSITHQEREIIKDLLREGQPPEGVAEIMCVSLEDVNSCKEDRKERKLKHLFKGTDVGRLSTYLISIAQVVLDFDEYITFMDMVKVDHKTVTKAHKKCAKLSDPYQNELYLRDRLKSEFKRIHSDLEPFV